MARGTTVTEPPAAVEVGGLETREAEPTTISIASLTRDPELICRAAGIKKATVTEYAEAMKAGASFPAVVVFLDSKSVHHLADGFHRCAAAELAGVLEVPADVRQGSRKDALLFAASANASHGLRRTNADKRKAVALLLAAYPKWSDRKIAEAVGVHNETVGTVRKRLTESVTPPETPAEPAAEQPAPSDATVERLSRALERLIAQWPPERRAELQKLIDAAVAARSTITPDSRNATASKEVSKK